MNYDVNQVGAASIPNTVAAQTAIATTTSAFGCSGAGAAAIDCAVMKGATIQSFSANGLGSPANGQLVQFVAPTTAGSVPFYAFPGRDPQLGQIKESNTIGRSVYNALQIRVKQDVNHPFHGVHRLSLLGVGGVDPHWHTHPKGGRHLSLQVIARVVVDRVALGPETTPVPLRAIDCELPAAERNGGNLLCCVCLTGSVVRKRG